MPDDSGKALSTQFAQVLTAVDQMLDMPGFAPRATRLLQRAKTVKISEERKQAQSASGSGFNYNAVMCNIPR